MGESGGMEENQKTKKTLKDYLSKKTLFYLSCMVLLYLLVWLGFRTMVNVSAGDENFIHESAGGIIILVLFFVAYRYFYYDIGAINQKKKAEKAKEIAQKAEAHTVIFTQQLELFKQAQSLEEKLTRLDSLGEIALTEPDFIQAMLKLIMPYNNWMAQHQEQIITSNLITWRLKGTLIEGLDEQDQSLSLKSLSWIERLLKQYAQFFAEGRAQETLKLSGYYLPALNLGFTEFPARCIDCKNTYLWQTSFWESHLHQTSFKDSDLRGANFWKCELDQINFENANLEKARLKTNLMHTDNITKEQFFSTLDWRINILSQDQIAVFFADASQRGPVWEEWTLAENERQQLIPQV